MSYVDFYTEKLYWLFDLKLYYTIWNKNKKTKINIMTEIKNKKESFNQIVGKKRFEELTGIPQSQYNESVNKFWNIHQKLFNIKGKGTKKNIGPSREEFISKYFIDKTGERTIRFVDFLQNIWVVGDSYDVFPVHDQEYNEYVEEWKNYTQKSIYELISWQEFIDIFPITFNELAKIAKFVSRNGDILADRAKAYERMWKVFQATLDAADKDDQQYLNRNPYDYVKLNGFSPNGTFRSIAEHLQKLKVLDQDYYILDQDRYDFYSELWQELREGDYYDYTIYEALPKETRTIFIEQAADAVQDHNDKETIRIWD